MQIPADMLVKIVYALGIGLLIGLERSVAPAAASEPSCSGKPGSRERSRPFPTQEKEDERVEENTILGIRTYSIISLSGFAAALVGTVCPVIASIIIAGVIGLIIALYFRSPSSGPGITTEIAAVTCCGLGVLCFSEPHLAGVLALLITVLLALKRSLRQALQNLKRIELTDTLKFLVVILIVLPLLPNRTIDPLGIFNPYKVMLLVILISGINFAGYFLTKFLGAHRGLSLMGFLGGLTSSTAVTAALASQAKTNPRLSAAGVPAVIIANATMFARVLVVVALLDFSLARRLAIPIGTMCLTAVLFIIFGFMISRKKSPPEEASIEDLHLKNPFSIIPAIRFSLFFVLILLIARIAKIYLGNQGLYLASLVSGLADVDAITLSIAEQTRNEGLALSTGSLGITIAVVANSVVKSVIAIYSGGWPFGKKVSLALLLSSALGLLTLLIR